jgi:hypothetical protein
MDFSAPPLDHDVLDEDLQIVRATLAAIADDVRRISRPAAEQVQEAIARLDRARREFSCQP